MLPPVMLPISPIPSSSLVVRARGARLRCLRTDEDKASYLSRLFDETYLRDIVESNHVRNDAQLSELVNAVSSSVGSFTNPQRLASTFRSVERADLSDPTIKKYLDYFQDAFLISSAKRYGVKGKQYIGTPLKYYFEDVGLRKARLGFRQQEETHIMENVIFNEPKVARLLLAHGLRIGHNT